MEDKDTRINFIKIFDEQVAKTLECGGFSYITERINDGQTLFVFEETPDLVELIKRLYDGTKFQETVIVRDSSLHF